jgi:serine kinase of HPr protein (carbohydrate metabolism regulator)|tara:strand:- start:1934 stop:2401 length:468 start_codon:yes stop_codon:yes gene_type:complete
MENKIEAEYNKFCKKFKLPKFGEIDKEFEISSLENERFLMRNILRKVAEKLEIYTEAIGNLVHPDASSLSSMYEIRFFNDNEKNDMYKMFKKLMKTNREIVELLLDANEKKDAEFLNSFFIQWLNMKNDLKTYINKMKESWEKETTIEEDIGYFG